MNNFTIDYSPLVTTLYKKGLILDDLKTGGGLHPKTVAKINKRESMTLISIGKICAYLNVGIDEVVRIELK